jgi:hypothetical protein
MITNFSFFIILILLFYINISFIFTVAVTIDIEQCDWGSVPYHVIEPKEFKMYNNCLNQTKPKTGDYDIQVCMLSLLLIELLLM